MRKVLTQSTTAYESALHPYRPGSDVSASSSLAATEPIGHPIPLQLRYDHRPTFGISLNELKAAIAPRAESVHSSYDETDRFTLCLTFVFGYIITVIIIIIKR